MNGYYCTSICFEKGKFICFTISTFCEKFEQLLPVPKVNFNFCENEILLL